MKEERHKNRSVILDCFIFNLKYFKSYKISKKHKKMSFKYLIISIIISFATSQTYFQVMPALSFKNVTLESIKNYTLSPEFEYKNKAIVFNHKTTEDKPTGSIVAKHKFHTSDFEFQISMKLSAKSSEGIFFGLFFLDNYESDTFDFNSQFKGFGLVFTSAPTAFEKEGKTFMNVRLIKNLKGESLEDLLYSNNFVKAECKDQYIINNKFKFFARVRNGALRSHYDNSEDMFNSCVRKGVDEFEKSNLRVAMLAYEGKNFLQDEKGKMEIYDIKNDIEIYSIRVFNMNDELRRRYTPLEDFTIVRKPLITFDNETLFKQANEEMDAVYQKFREYRLDVSKGKINAENKDEYQKKLNQGIEEIIKTFETIKLLFHKEDLKMTKEKMDETFQVIYDYLRNNYNDFIERDILPFEKLDLLSKNLDNYRKSIKYTESIQEGINKATKGEEEDNNKKLGGANAFKADL